MEINHSENNQWLLALQPVVQLCEQFSSGCLLDVSEFRQKILLAIAQFESSDGFQGLSRRERSDAKYAVVAFVDEWVLYSAQKDIAAWQKEPLQVVLFKDNLAGEAFFDRLENYQKDPSKHSVILTLYYICLSLGFSGRYRFHQQSHLMAFRKSLAAQLGFLDFPDLLECQSTLPDQKANRHFLKRLGFLRALLFISGIAVAAVYLSCIVNIDQKKTEVMSAISEGQTIFLESREGGPL